MVLIREEGRRVRFALCLVEDSLFFLVGYGPIHSWYRSLGAEQSLLPLKAAGRRNALASEVPR